ncbi:oxidoreductase [Flammeovirga sp. EKP202]|uniref:oxidoreductase n=1 Tax=Flammeovirga sp. EKP202 TaxID=2770592 RepID=UPI00165F9233|nr:oxidoreductase [Flammeovirga sp. EKP202]MBD0401788.1 SDR family NAD(P)-dependent oxidoreductase [Flammeovirga sp. EKP202]
MKRVTLFLVAIFTMASVILNAQDKQVVLITGTASGFGKATAEKLIEKGYIVYGGDIQVEENKYLDKIGGHALVMDVTKEDQVKAGVQKVIDEQGRIDVLINNAGYGSYATIENIGMDELNYQFDVNVFGYARLQQAVLPHMRKQKSGRIINVSSVVGEVSTPMLGWYAATKHAIEAMSDALRMEVKHLNIDVVKIQPGAVKTGFDAVAFAKMEASYIPEDYEELADDFKTYMVDSYTKVEGPRGTADFIVKAVEAKKAKTQYRTTADARLLMKIKDWRSEKAFDKMMSKQLKKGADKVRKNAEK